MARQRAVGADITTADVAALVQESKLRRIGEAPRRQYVIDKIIEQNPGIEQATIRRNGQVFTVLDYLMEGSDLA